MLSAEADAAADAALANSAFEQRAAYLRTSLAQAVRAERDARSVFPWIMLGVGITAVVTGVAIGVVTASGCEDSCHEPGWPPFAVIGGAALAAGGTLWLLILERDEAELAYRRRQLEEAIRREQWERAGHPRSALSFSTRF